MYTSRLPQLVILIFLSPILGLREPNNTSLYRPIHLRDYESAFGIQRRASEEFADLEPKSQAHLVYGQYGNDEQLLLADMKLHASNGLDIVLLERFDHLTSSVDCYGDDGLMSLTFRSKDVFDRARKAWGFVNREDTNFLLIANHEACSSEDQRQPYIISRIREDEVKLTTLLTARPAPWSDVASHFEMNFGHAMPKQRSLRRRGLGDVAFAKGATANLNVGTPGEKFTIISGGRLSKSNSIACSDCYMLGKLTVNGKINVENFAVKTFVLNALPEDFEAALEFDVVVDDPEKIKQLSWEKTLASAPIPGAGVLVKDIFELGLIAKLVAGYTTKLKDGFEFKIGAKTKIPGPTRITIDGVDHPNIGAYGFEGASVEPIFELVSMSKTVDFSLAVKPTLVFGVDIIGADGLDLTLILNLPELKTTFAPTFKPKGACSKEPGAQKTGVEVKSKIDMELDLKIERVKQQWGAEDIKTQLWETKLWDFAKPLYSHCFPLGIPALIPKKGQPPNPKSPGSKPVPSGGVIYPSGGSPPAHRPSGIPHRNPGSGNIPAPKFKLHNPKPIPATKVYPTGGSPLLNRPSEAPVIKPGSGNIPAPKPMIHSPKPVPGIDVSPGGGLPPLYRPSGAPSLKSGSSDTTSQKPQNPVTKPKVAPSKNNMGGLKPVVHGRKPVVPGSKPRTPNKKPYPTDGLPAHKPSGSPTYNFGNDENKLYPIPDGWVRR